MPVDTFGQIQRSPPFGRLTPRTVYPLALEKLWPVIRIAHRQAAPLLIAERIIFDHELVLILAGQGDFVFGQDRFSFGPHELFWIAPFVPHSFAADQCEHLAVHFDFAPNVPPVRQSLTRRRPYGVRLPGGLALPRHSRLVAHDRVEEELSRLVEAWQPGDALGQLEATGCLLRVLTTLLRRTDAPGKGARDRLRIEQALGLLRGPGVKTPAELARAVGLSVSHFNRLFREWTGFSPVDYQRRQRVARARKLLSVARLSIKEIAAQCGFDDPYHFSRVFRQVDGLSPSQYREAVLAGRSR